jgi:glycosyltransferase involved in cell wall biosynthesis
MKKISIIIPVYNEEKTVQVLLERVFSASASGLEKEIIIVDDCSRDRSYEILSNLKRENNFQLFRHEKNYGKGRALRSGFQAATGDIILIQDADLEYDPANWERIIKEFEKKETGVVYGSRNIKPKRRGYFHCIIGVKVLTGLINLLYGSKLTDSYTCYKCFRRELLRDMFLESDGFEIEAELTTKLLRRGYKIKEVPIDYHPRKFEEGKKIGWRDGLLGLWVIVRNRY